LQKGDNHGKTETNSRNSRSGFAIGGGITWFLHQYLVSMLLWGAAGLILLKLNKAKRNAIQKEDSVFVRRNLLAKCFSNIISWSSVGLISTNQIAIYEFIISHYDAFDSFLKEIFPMVFSK
jgi:hypothetical protein